MTHKLRITGLGGGREGKGEMGNCINLKTVKHFKKKQDFFGGYTCQCDTLA